MSNNLNDIPVWLIVGLKRFADVRLFEYDNDFHGHYGIYPKDGQETTNTFLVKVLDYILDEIDNHSTKLKIQYKKIK